MNSRRVAGLDWLRGLMAVSIMVYHYISWTIGDPGAASLLGRLGIYGVSTFYVLSGLSLAIAYDKIPGSLANWRRFFIRRVFRILPLMWVATTLVLALNAVTAQPQPSTYRIFLNYTTIFGLLDPAAYIPTGAWSIGNEMVFYLFIPFVIGLYHKSKAAGDLFTIASWSVGLVYAFVLLDGSGTLGAQWSLYVNPFNQLFLFTSGLFLYYNFPKLHPANRWIGLFLLLAVIAFCILPATGDGIALVTGINRISLSAIIIAVVFLFWKLDIALPTPLQYSLNQLGEATYSIYLLHPFVFTIIAAALRYLGLYNTALVIGVCIPATILLSLLVYRWYEQPFMNLGRKLSRYTPTYIPAGR